METRTIEQYLNESMESNALVGLWNDYCDETNRFDDSIFSMDDFDELMSGKQPHEIASRVCYGDFNYRHDYFAFNGYANLVSFDYADDKNSPISTYELAKWLADMDEDEAQDRYDFLSEIAE